MGVTYLFAEKTWNWEGNISRKQKSFQRWTKLFYFTYKTLPCQNKKSRFLDLNWQMLKNIWLDHCCIIITVWLQTAFNFFKELCRNGHIPGWQCQDSSGSNCERMVGREKEEWFSHTNGHLWIQTLHSVKVFGMCWRRLYRVLDSCIVNIGSWPKMDASLDGNNITKCFLAGQCILIFS